MSEEERILSFLKATGPTIPVRVAKNIKSDTLIASAHLSQLSSRGKIKISSLKIGSSPLYYLPGQENQLFEFAKQNLNPKDFKVLCNLKEQKLLREKSLDLLSKVALRNLKDFAIPLQVNYGGESELFWKWYLLNNEEANELLREQILGTSNSQEEQTQLTDVNKDSKEQIKEEVSVVKELKSESNNNESNEKEKQKEIIKPELKPKKIEKKKPKGSDKFVTNITSYLEELEIEIQEQEIIRKNSEVDFILLIPSVVGKMKYFCKAKSKQRCDEKDVSTAYMQAQIKKLPLLFLYKNQLTKKAEEMLSTDAFENAVIKKIENGS